MTCGLSIYTRLYQKVKTVLKLHSKNNQTLTRKARLRMWLCIANHESTGMKDRGQTYGTRAVVCFLWEWGVKPYKNPSADVGTVWSIHHGSKNYVWYLLRSSTEKRCNTRSGLLWGNLKAYPRPRLQITMPPQPSGALESMWLPIVSCLVQWVGRYS